jgi:hypothetical protein
MPLSKNVINGLRKCVSEALAKQVADKVKQTQLSQIQEIVYDAGKPSAYVRREAGGGLKSPENTVSNVISKGNVSVLETRNITPVNPIKKENFIYYAGKDKGFFRNSHAYPLVNLIEKGTAAPLIDNAPRPFMKATAASLKASGAHLKALKAGLEYKGLKVGK